MVHMASRTRHSLVLPEVLVRWDPTKHAVLTVYADWRVNGRGLRDAAISLRKALHEAEGMTLAHAGARDSLHADTESVREYLDEVADPGARGLAIFACEAQGLWRARTFRVPFPTLTHVGERPLLLPLAEVIQDDRPCLVALADTTRVRLIAIRPSDVEQTSELTEQTWAGARLGSHSGWRAGHEQHARETMLDRFTRDVAAAVDATLAHEHFDDLVVAGDAVITPALVEALSARASDALRFVTAIDMRATVDEVVDAVWPRLLEAGRAERGREVDELVERAGGQSGYTAAPAEIAALLEGGMGDTVAFDPAVVEAEAAEVLLREGLLHGTRVIIARGHEALAAAGGAVAKSR
jgi:hypothetical protein